MQCQLARLAIYLCILLFKNITITADVISKQVQCITVKGQDPQYSNDGSGGSYYSRASCVAPYTLISCGAEPKDVNLQYNSFKGTYIHTANNEQVCETWSWIPGGCCGGIIAYARCCNSTIFPESSVVTDSTPWSGTNDDAHISLKCSSSHELIGCTSYSNEEYFDGSYAGWNDMHEDHLLNTLETTSNQCNARNGEGGNGAKAYGRCIDKSIITDGYELNCFTVWGPHSSDYSGSGSYPTSTVSCPSNYFMTSCSGYSPWSSLGQYNINAQDQCVVTHTKNGAQYGGYWVVANAICCSLTKDTNNPTIDPTIYPTQYPTFNPTGNPSTNPTTNPSVNPSVNPTTNPSANPTTNPTLNPTIDPSDAPSKTPTYHPTAQPPKTPIAPTSSPTKRPTASLSTSHVPTTSPINNGFTQSAVPTLPQRVSSNENQKETNTDSTIAIVLVCIICIMVLIIIGIIKIWIAREKIRKKHESETQMDENVAPPRDNKNSIIQKISLELGKIKSDKVEEESISDEMYVNGSHETGKETLDRTTIDADNDNGIFDSDCGHFDVRTEEGNIQSNEPIISDPDSYLTEGDV